VTQLLEEKKQRLLRDMQEVGLAVGAGVS
jgi:hypothetical protein